MKPATTAHPHNPWLAHTVRVSRMAAATPGVFMCDLVFEDPNTATEYAFAPGQFNMLYLPGLGEIAISVSGDPGQRGRQATPSVKPAMSLAHWPHWRWVLR